MDGLQDAIFVKIYVLGISQFLSMIVLKLLRKNGLKILVLIH